MSVHTQPPAQADALTVGWDLARSGQITESLRTMATVSDDDEDTARTCTKLATVVECRLARGELGHAIVAGDLLAQYADHPGRTGALTLCALGELASARGIAEVAATNYGSAGSRLSGALDDPDTVPWRVGAAMALTRLGQRRDAHLLALEHLALARGTGSPYAIALGLRTMAATTADGGRVPLLREAQLSVTEVRADRLAAQINTDLAVLLTLQAEPDGEAVLLLRAAEEYAAREDLFPLQHRVRRLLERLGEQPMRIRSESLAALTNAEQRAARLAAQGLTNRQIAEALSVTVKAVEWHLSHVYRKLGIHSRTSLTDSLGIPI